MENQHLLDATEIFRKLNVHKKVCAMAVIAGIGKQETNGNDRNHLSSSASI